MHPRLVRSKLFVPGSRPDFFGKALAGVADAVSFDLEDSVAAALKDEARRQVVAALQGAAGVRTPLLIVRINGLGTPWFEDDLRAVVLAAPGWINLPKAGSARDVQRAAAAIEAAEAAAGIERPIGLLVNVETATALARAAEIAAAHPRVVGLQLGLADLFEPLGIDRGDPANVHAAMFALRVAAAAAGVDAFDGAYPDFTDVEGFRAEAQRARRLGYVGKSCIHPNQVAAANETFGATPEQLARARRIVDAADRAGGGAFAVDGQMVDAPILRRARALIGLADGAA